MHKSSEINKELEEFDSLAEKVKKQENSQELDALLKFNKDVITLCNSKMGGNLVVRIDENPIYPMKKSLSNPIFILHEKSQLSCGAIFSSYDNINDTVSTSITCDGPAEDDGSMYRVNCLSGGNLIDLQKNVADAAEKAALGIIKHAKKIMQQKLH